MEEDGALLEDNYNDLHHGNSVRYLGQTLGRTVTWQQANDSLIGDLFIYDGRGKQRERKLTQVYFSLFRMSTTIFRLLH